MVTACTESSGKTLSANTIAGYYSSGLELFYRSALRWPPRWDAICELDDIDRHFIDHFIAHLRQSVSNLAFQKIRYTNVKSVLVAMGHSGWIAKIIFPRNPYPNSNRSSKGQLP